MSGDVNVSGVRTAASNKYPQVTQSVHAASCCLTSGEYFTKGKRVPVAKFSTQDVIRFYASVQWDDPTKGAGIHDINYNWYSGNKLVSTFSRRCEFVRSPTDLHTTRTASDLGIGHFKVEILVDDNVIGSKEFDIVQ